MRYPLLTLVVGLLLFAPAAFAETRVFDLVHRRAVDVLEPLRSALGADAQVTAVDRSLVVSASPDRLVVAAELLARLDRPLRMLRVFVAQDQTLAATSRNAGLSGRVSSGDATVVIGRPDMKPRGGTTVIVGGGQDRLRLDAGTSMSRETRSAEQFIVTLEGSPARISVGRRVPFTERWIHLTRRHAMVVENLHYESMDTGFEVRPELFGDMVQLEVHPFLAFQDPHRPSDIHFQELTTTARIPLGEWFDLGGSMASHDEISREILGAAGSSGSEEQIVRIRVELQPE